MSIQPTRMHLLHRQGEPRGGQLSLPFGQDLEQSRSLGSGRNRRALGGVPFRVILDGRQFRHPGTAFWVVKQEGPRALSCCDHA
ncbi:hypothetical protein [Sabulicella rubraurantiaca]|uniref:hypothetical protein n=1 Tax=Sabulicella rubraurantiaca TaxID=2811429 RepID=UPI001A960A2F|nr:hypothetical protein [Sabulicella rubraurantiaca]